jgi:hypothetical protein
VIFTSDGGSTYFLSPEGVEKHRIANPVWHRDSFQVHDDVLYFAPGPLARPHSLGAYDLREQAYLWLLDTASMGASWYSFPALRRNAVHLATCAARRGHWELTYYAYDRRTGELIWKHRDRSSFGEGSISDSGLAALYRRNLKLLDYLSPSLWRNLVVYTSGDAVVRAFRAGDGQPAWRRVFDSPTSSAPTVAGDRVYFGLHGEVEGLIPGSPALGASAPGVEGEARGEGGPPGRLEAAAARKPRLVCLSVRDGGKLWEMELEGALLSAPVIAGKWLVFGTDRNMFYVLEELY